MTEKAYNKQYDAYFNPVTDEWLEKRCSDPECEFCTTRPDKPSQVTNV